MSAAQHLPLALLIVGGCYYIPKGSDDSSLRDSGSQVESTWYADDDGDGYGRDDDVLRSTTQPEGYAAVGGDCDDNSADRNPGEIDVCNDGEDQDCDGEDVACPEARRTGTVQLSGLMTQGWITTFGINADFSALGIAVSGLSGVTLGGAPAFAIGATGAGFVLDPLSERNGFVYVAAGAEMGTFTLDYERLAALSTPVQAGLTSSRGDTLLGSMVVDLGDILVVGAEGDTWVEGVDELPGNGSLCVWSKSGIAVGKILSESQANFCIGGDDDAKLGQFGYTSAALLDDEVVVATTDGTSGSVYILNRSALSSTTPSKPPLVTNPAYASHLTNPGGESDFGASLATLDCSTDGGRLLVGAPDIDSVFVFDESLVLVGLLEEKKSSSVIQFGAAIAVMPISVSDPTESVVIVGSPADESVYWLSAESICALNDAATSTDPTEIMSSYYYAGSSKSEQFGRTLAPLGDVDGDGLNDLGVGRKEFLYVLYGGGGKDVDVSFEPNDAYWKVSALSSSEASFPSAIAGPGDLNGDGLAEILFGDNQLDASGAAWLIWSSN